MSGADYGNEDSHMHIVVYVVFLSVLIIFVFVGGWMESKHLVWGHETGFVITFGMLISFLMSRLGPEEGDDLVIKFDKDIFFDIALPAILFAAGYNMRRKEFFRNFVNIVKFGIFGSLFTYALFVGLTYLLF